MGRTERGDSVRSPSPSRWHRLQPRARVFIAFVLLGCGAPALVSVLLELTRGPTTFGLVLPWAGFVLSALSIIAVVRPRGQSPLAWFEQLRARINSETRH